MKAILRNGKISCANCGKTLAIGVKIPREVLSAHIKTSTKDANILIELKCPKCCRRTDGGLNSIVMG